MSKERHLEHLIIVCEELQAENERLESENRIISSRVERLDAELRYHNDSCPQIQSELHDLRMLKSDILDLVRDEFEEDKDD